MNIDFAKPSFGMEEVEAVWRVLKTDWLASGQENLEFEREFAEYFGSKYAVCVNSGSSANLLALASLNLKKGSKVLTAACGFPATLNPILHLGLEPVFVDYHLPTHNPDIDQVLEKMDGCKAIILAHTLGFPFDIERVMEKAYKLGIYVIEDCCEAIGAYKDIGEREAIGHSLLGKIKYYGTFGTLGTFSFYPAHQITALGMGGMIITDNTEMANRMRSMRDWGKRYDWNSFDNKKLDFDTYRLGDTITNYDDFYYPGYTYTTIGYNMKLGEANAAFGRVQLKNLKWIVSQRLGNWWLLKDKLNVVHNLGECIITNEREELTTPSPFGFCLTMNHPKLDRNDFGKWLESQGIRHRPFFAGNILRQPAYRELYDYIGNHNQFPIADRLMKDSLFVGCWAGMNLEQLDYLGEKLAEWIKLQFSS